MLFSDDEITGIPLRERYPWMKDKQFVCVESIEQLQGIVDQAVKAGICVIDLESSGLDLRVYDGVCNTFIAGFALSFDGKTGYYVPVNHGVLDEGKFLRLPELNLEFEPVKVQIQRILDNCVTIYHNCMYDHELLAAWGFKVREFIDAEKEFETVAFGQGGSKIKQAKLAFHCTLIMASLYDASLKSKRLKLLSEQFLHMKMLELTDIFEEGEEIRFYLLNPKTEERTVIYASSDAICTFLLYQHFKHIENEQPFIYHLERRTTFATRQMERNRIRIDVRKLQEFQAILLNMKKEIEEQANQVLGRQINLGSPSQVAKVLYEEMKLDIVAKGKDGQPELNKNGDLKFETDEKSLSRFKDVPIVDLILTYRDINKTLGTYIENLLNRYDRNNEVKLKFLPLRTETGRFAASGGDEAEGTSGINVQALTKPLKPEKKKDKKTGEPLTTEQIIRLHGSGWFLRSCLIARPGYKLVAIDYSGEELRVAANVSREKIWTKEFLEGPGDLHTETAKIIFKTQTPDGTQRDICKVLNFQTLYGGGPFAISQAIGISVEEAKEFQQRLLGGLLDLKRWIDRTKKEAHKTKYAITPFGRRRPLHYINSEDRGEVSKAERLAINTPIQGAGGDIMKMAMVRTNDYLNKHGDEVRMLITVHDELVFEIKEDKLDVHIPELMNLMSLDNILSGVLKWPVPLSMDCEVGDSWEVEYEYFKRNPQQLTKLNDNLRGMKIRALGLDPKTLQPKDKPKAAEPKVEAPKVETPKVEAPKVEAPKAETPKPEAKPEPVKVEAVETTVPEVSTEASVVSLENSDVPDASNFHTGALEEAIEVFRRQHSEGRNSEAAFLLALQRYVQIAPKAPVIGEDEREGKYLMQEYQKSLKAWERYCYVIQTVFTESKLRMLDFLIQQCQDGFNPYTIKTRDGVVVFEGPKLNALKFDILATFHNI